MNRERELWLFVPSLCPGIMATPTFPSQQIVIIVMTVQGMVVIVTAANDGQRWNSHVFIYRFLWLFGVYNNY